jgi:1L-myo-inositol 1-phosphate cytidylyltransferase / CDP-L-myo-inositol myo-inositolphosphotransferase
MRLRLRLDAVAFFRHVSPRMEVVIFADAPEALMVLCGVSLLERQLRILQRLGFVHATIVSATGDKICAAIEPPSWARRGLTTRIITHSEMRLATRALFLPGDIYCDARLIRALAECEGECVLVDSAPPQEVLPLLCDLKRDARGFVSNAAVTANYDSLGELPPLDAARVPPYILRMRRALRPIFFPAPSSGQMRRAERLVLDTGQNGTLDIPAIVHAPAETAIIRWLCRTAVTPNQITAFGIAVGLIATVLFATGHLGWAVVFAVGFGVIDGVDGKLARVKIETTQSGKWEHIFDFFLEMSWWAALAFFFSRGSGQRTETWIWFAVILMAEVLDQLVKPVARAYTGRQIDDVSAFDRFVRLIGARRNIYVWSLALGVLFDAAAFAYQFCAVWGALTTLVHALRAGMIAARGKVHPR